MQPERNVFFAEDEEGAPAPIEWDVAAVWGLIALVGAAEMGAVLWFLLRLLPALEHVGKRLESFL